MESGVPCPEAERADSVLVFDAVSPGGASVRRDRNVAVEQPVALEFDGVAYAITMASPGDLVDLAYGFALGERLIARVDEVLDVEVHEGELGASVRIALVPERREQVFERVRRGLTGTSCGLCGIEALEQALRPLPRVAERTAASIDSVFRALAAMRAHQKLDQRTGAVHAALACDAEGGIVAAREDVGRHNAFDKLIGAMLRVGRGWEGGFALLSSRCSYELVEKAALAGCPMLVTVSAATSLAVERAAEAGVKLVSLARDDSVLVAP